MKYVPWLFKKVNLSLRTELIVNISFLMLAAILLVGFTISKIVEKNILREKIRYGGKMLQDFQTHIDFISKDNKESSFKTSGVKREIQDFVQIYTKEKGFYDLLIVDPQLNIIASKKPELISRRSANPLLQEAVQSGQLKFEIEKSGNFLTAIYKSMKLFSPLWSRGKILGGVQMEVWIGDIPANLLESQKIILFTMFFDAIILIVFGSFLLSRVLVKPVKDLLRLTKRISEGDFSQKIEVTTRNEMGELIESFNRMIGRLKENQDSLEKHLESLESANKQLAETQEELIRTEKLASIGRFAAGVAHEVGNPLGAILGYTNILKKEGIDHQEAKDYMERIEGEIERINKIVRELLNFARPSKLDIRNVEINKVLENTLSLLSYQKDFKNVDTKLELQSDLPMVKGDESQLSQVFINIVLNAVDAMPNGGVLHIQTREHIIGDLKQDWSRRLYPSRRENDSIECDYSHLRRYRSFSTALTKISRGDRLVTVRISDTGNGIKKGNLENIFDPFFTTKSPDKGTGLGLSISLKIVESLGGEIRVQSEEGKGTSFEIHFPAVL